MTKGSVKLKVKAGAIVLLATATVLTAPYSAMSEDKLTAREIVDRSLKNNTLGLDEAVATVQMFLYSKRGTKRERSIESKSKKVGDISKHYIKFLSPPDVSGTAFQNIEEGGGETIQRLYLPAIKKVRKISSTKKKSRFMGTDFTYKDMEVRDIDDATYKRLPDEKFAGQDVWVIEATPKNPDESGYAKLTYWIDKKREIPLKVLFFDLKGKELKVLKVKRFKEFEGQKKGGDRWVAMESEMTNLQEGTKTELLVKQISFDVKVPDEVFEEKYLSRG